VLYGGAEFSRDTDLAILADSQNLIRLRAALAELSAICIAVPPFERKYLTMGLAIHFRCEHPDAMRMRIDVMSKMRGVADFPLLWERRTTVDSGGETIDVLSLPDLVLSKKTQRDKDWPMIKRLVEAKYFVNRDRPTEQQIRFWLLELRTVSLLTEAVERFGDEARALTAARPLLALDTNEPDYLAEALKVEELEERERDRQYWAPLRKELQRLRAER